MADFAALAGHRTASGHWEDGEGHWEDGDTKRAMRIQPRLIGCCIGRRQIVPAGCASAQPRIRSRLSLANAWQGAPAMMQHLTCSESARIGLQLFTLTQLLQQGVVRWQNLMLLSARRRGIGSP